MSLYVRCSDGYDFDTHWTSRLLGTDSTSIEDEIDLDQVLESVLGRLKSSGQEQTFLWEKLGIVHQSDRKALICTLIELGLAAYGSDDCLWVGGSPRCSYAYVG